MSKSKTISLKDFESKLIKDLKDPFKQNKAFEILLDKYLFLCLSNYSWTRKFHKERPLF